MSSSESPIAPASRWEVISTHVNREAKRLAETRGWARYGIAFGMGALTATALAPYYVLPALLFGFTALVVLLDGAHQSATPRRMALFTGWAFGFGYFLFGMYWLGFAFLVQADQFAWMIPFAIPGFTGFLGLFFAVPALLAILGWNTGPSRIILLGALLAVFEFLRGNILTGLPWNLTSQTMAGSALLAQPLAWIGPYGYSLVILLLAMLPAAAIKGTGTLKVRPFFGLLAGVGVILLFGLIRLGTAIEDSLPPSTAIPQLIIVQPNVSQKDKLDEDKRTESLFDMLNITNEAAAPLNGPALAVWPENAYPWLANAEDAPAFFAERLPENVSLFSGSIRAWQDEEDQERYGNSAVLFGTTEIADGLPQKPLLDVYDKHHLVPFGEYLPLEGLLTLLGISQLANIEDGFTPGPGPRTIEANGVRFAPLICFEDIFPGQLYPKRERPELLVIVTNDAWFGDNAGPQQHLDISRMRAIESGLPVARSANTGISAILSGNGVLLHYLPLYETGVISAPMPYATNRPIYDKVEQIPFIFMLLACSYFGLRHKLAREGQASLDA